MTVTPRFRLNLPAYNVPGWDDDVNDNFIALDTLLFQIIYINNIQGVWQNSTAYTVGQKAIDDADSTLWECLIDHTSAASGTFAADRGMHSTYWQESNTITSDVITAAAAAVDAATAAGLSATASATSATASATSATTAGTQATAAGVSATAAATSATNAATAVANAGSYKNQVMNGAMLVAQRTPPYTVASGVVTRTLDRWNAFRDGAGGTTAVSALVSSNTTMLDAGFRSELRYQVTVAAAGQTIAQLTNYMENVNTLSGRQVTLSFYAYVASGTISMTATLAQNFGSGGSPSATVNTAVGGTFNITTTPTRFQATVTVPSISGKTLGSSANGDALILALNLPIAGTFDLRITGVQLELGASATNFEHLPYSVVWEMVQRYYQTMTLYGTARGNIGDAVTAFYNLHQAMRTGSPTLAVPSNFNSNYSLVGRTLTNLAAFSTGTITATGVWLINENWTADADY